MATDLSSKPDSAPGDDSGDPHRRTLPGARLHTPPAEPAARVSSLPLWFPAFDASATPSRPNPSGWIALLVFALAAILAVVLRNTLLRIALPSALLLAAAVLLRTAWKLAAHEKKKRQRGLRFEGQRLWFQSPGRAAEQTLLITNPKNLFGITLFATPHRDRVLMMITSEFGTFCVGSRFDASARRMFVPLLELAFTVTSDEDVLEAIGPDGKPLMLENKHFAGIIHAIADRAGACFERIVQSDAQGAPVLLNGSELHIGDKTFDLCAPLDWRGIVFQENMGQSVVVYQGTWLSQGADEVVLVSLLPSIMSVGLSGILEGAPISALDRGVLRDLRLMQMSPESPPPNERRVAVDRLLMLPLRNAIDAAPRVSRQRVKRAQHQS